MRHPRRGDLATTVGWSELVDELDRWSDAGQVATLWWRDDDAIAASDRLDRLASIAGHIPISLAVIPATADAGLAAWLTRASRTYQGARLAALQHGWCHASYAANGKKSEFPAGRSCRAVAADLSAGRARLIALFGTRALPVLAPPWNRFDTRFLPLLASCGLRAISRVNPRLTAWPAPGITEVNVHVDLVAWTGNRGFIGEGAALDGLIRHLQARRRSEVDAEEPTGILTHHLIHDERTDEFLRQLAAVTGTHRAAHWLDGAEVFAGVTCVRR
jgi:peptidoglycan/xylan/chitin deacetylase (PgdA/CDA1 family)